MSTWCADRPVKFSPVVAKLSSCCPLLVTAQPLIKHATISHEITILNRLVPAVPQSHFASDLLQEFDQNWTSLIAIGPQVIAQGLMDLAIGDERQFCLCTGEF